MEKEKNTLNPSSISAAPREKVASTASNRRVEQTPKGLYFIFVGLLVILAGGLYALNFPSNQFYGLVTAIVGFAITLGGLLASPQLGRDLATSRRTWLWVNDAILVLAIIGIAVMLSYIGFRRHIRYDFTRDRLFSISDQTIAVLRGLKKEVKITAFFPLGSVEGQMIQDLVKEYKRWNEKLQFQLVDPHRDPITVKTMNVKMVPSVVVVCETNRKELFGDEMFQRPNPMMGNREPPKFLGEQVITSAILNVTQGRRRKVVFSTGHEEPGIRVHKDDGITGLVAYLNKENFEVTEGSLMDGVATDAAILVLIAPRKALHPTEIKNLKEFILERKGHLMVAVNPYQSSPDLEKFFSEVYGVNMNDEIIINGSQIAQDPTMLIPSYSPHKIIQSLFDKKIGIVMQMCRGLNIEERPQWTAVPFLKTADQTYAKRQKAELESGKITFTQGVDANGPFVVGLALEGKDTASGTRAVFFGSSAFLSNQLLQVVGNADLVMNTANWLVGQEEMLSIRPKSVEFGMVTVPADAAQRVFFLSVLAAPMLIMLVGGMVWWRRRRV